jgi:hypothetical protein
MSESFELTNTPRDTEFSGFASSLFDDLAENARKSDVDLFSPESLNAFYNQQKLTIARRVYDLVHADLPNGH